MPRKHAFRKRQSRNGSGQLNFEKLENRRLLATGHMHSHVEVTNDFVVTGHDKIPRFGSNPTITAIEDGEWSNPSIWSTGRVPGANEIVSIPENLTVVYDVDSQVELDVVEVSGVLDFKHNLDTSLWLNELMVMPSGSLIIGTAQTPILEHVKSEIVFTDTPGESGFHYKTGSLDLPGIDPEQYGNGLIVFGLIDVNGSAKTSFARSTGSIEAGASSVELDRTVSGWQVGDEVVLPETSQTVVTRGLQELYESETLVLKAVEGNQVTFSSTAIHNHGGITKNSFGIERNPHVANLTRNVVFRSENAEGVRGHLMFTGEARVSLSNVEVRAVGRTRADAPVDNTLFVDDGQSELYQIGSNQIGRYGIHLHHLTNSFHVDNASVVDALKWGVTVHDSNNGTIENSVVYDVDGAGIVTEGGNETGNSFLNNVVIKVDGGHQKLDHRAGAAQRVDAQGKLFIEIGADGSGFWLRSSAGTFTGNTVYDAASYGFNFNGYYRTPSMSEGDFFHQQVDLFQNNEAASSKGGLWLTWSQGQSQIENYQRQTFSDFVAWHVSGEGVKAYHEANLTFEDIYVVGNATTSNLNEGSPTVFDARVSTGLWFGSESYQNFNLQLDRVHVEGFNLGLVVPVHSGTEGTTLSNSIFRNYVNIAMPSSADVESLSHEFVTFLPSHVVRTSDAMPDEVADIWHEALGVIDPGEQSLDGPPGVPPSLPVEIDFRASDGRLAIVSGENSDSIVVFEDGDKLFFEINDEDFSVNRDDVVFIIFWGHGGDDVFENNSTIPLTAFGGLGNDRLIGGLANDKLIGGLGLDEIFGRDGNDLIYGGEDDDFLDGGAGVDKIRGQEGNDILYGGSGSDAVLSGGAGLDQIFGGSGNDVLAGGDGDDELFGGKGKDSLSGQVGDDKLYGGEGDDVVNGGLGNDILQGNEGRDKLRGGYGNDLLVYDLFDWVVDGGDGEDELLEQNALALQAFALQVTRASN